LASTDFACLAELPYYARGLGARSSDEEQSMTLDAIKELLEDGLWRAGDLCADGFADWGGSTDEKVTRIEWEWSAHVGQLTLGDICWFANTPTGNEAARALLAAGFQSSIED